MSEARLIDGKVFAIGLRARVGILIVLFVVFIRCQIIERHTSFDATIRALSKPSEYPAG